MAYSDVAPEFEAAMSELRIPLDHSLPGKPNNNSLAERTNQEIINTVATAIWPAGGSICREGSICQDDVGTYPGVTCTAF